MKDKAPVRNGTFSDADLAADCDERAISLETYLTELSGEGLTAAQLTAFRAATTAFRKLPTDDNLAEAVSSVVTQRNVALEAARTGLRQASQPIARAFGDESAEYDSFDVGEVSRKSVTEVLNLLQTVPGVGTPYLTNPKAVAEGFGAARLTPLAALYTALFTQETALNKAQTAARLGTRTRVLAYNALNTTCSAYCAKGYDYFVEKDATKAHLFVRQPASSPDAAVAPLPPVPPEAGLGAAAAARPNTLPTSTRQRGRGHRNEPRPRGERPGPTAAAPRRGARSLFLRPHLLSPSVSETLQGVLVRPDCRHFRGDVPCRPNKTDGYVCQDCPAYAPVTRRLLIIKLGAIGDVIRTTPLLRRLRQEFPGCFITWLTLTPAILPQQEVDEILKFDFASALQLQAREFDAVYNLDKEKEACALLNTISARAKFGYALRPADGVAWPVNELADHKFLTGVFDQLSLQNQKPYAQEIFELCGFDFRGEEYVFDTHEDKGYDWSALPRPTAGPRIGLNTGCGDRWTTRLWSDEKWLSLIGLLQQAGYAPVLLGGEAEAARNQRLQQATGAAYLGTFPLPQFINLMHQLDGIVTQVTMAMHISIALRKPTVLMNNIFNPHEFDLYGRGQLVGPERECVCFYRGSCCLGTSCMEELPAEKVFAAVQASVPVAAQRLS